MPGSSSTTSNAEFARNPHAAEPLAQIPAGCGGAGPSAALPLLDDAHTSPASRRLASGPAALATRLLVVSPRAASPERTVSITAASKAAFLHIQTDISLHICNSLV